MIPQYAVVTFDGMEIVYLLRAMLQLICMPERESISPFVHQSHSHYLAGPRYGMFKAVLRV